MSDTARETFDAVCRYLYIEEQLSGDVSNIDANDDLMIVRFDADNGMCIVECSVTVRAVGMITQDTQGDVRTYNTFEEWATMMEGADEDDEHDPANGVWPAEPGTRTVIIHTTDGECPSLFVVDGDYSDLHMTDINENFEDGDLPNIKRLFALVEAQDGKPSLTAEQATQLIREGALLAVTTQSSFDFNPDEWDEDDSDLDEESH